MLGRQAPLRGSTGGLRAPRGGARQLAQLRARSDPPRQDDERGPAHLAEKYGISLEEALAMYDHVTEAAKGEGVEMRWDMTRGGNTFDAHRLLHLASKHDCQDALKERVLFAYFTEGEAIGDQTALARLAAEVGLPQDDVRDVLETDRYAEARDDERTAASLGIRGVPFFVIDRAFAASGAQPPEALRQLLLRGWEARPSVQVVEGGDSCGVDGC